MSDRSFEKEFFKGCLQVMEDIRESGSGTESGGAAVRDGTLARSAPLARTEENPQ
jgi:hypothetical protein